MKSNSPVHMWFRCIDMEVRGFFIVESLYIKPMFNQPTGSLF